MDYYTDIFSISIITLPGYSQDSPEAMQIKNDIENFIQDKFYAWVKYDRVSNLLLLNLENCNPQLLFSTLETVLYLNFEVILLPNWCENEIKRTWGHLDWYNFYKKKYQNEKLKQYQFLGRNTDLVTKEELINGDY